MAGIVWSKEEISFLKKEIKKGNSIEKIVNNINKKFKTGRTVTGVQSFCSRNRISYLNASSISAASKLRDLPLKDQLTVKYYKDKLSALEKDYEKVLDGLNIQKAIIDRIQVSTQALPKAPSPVIPKKYKQRDLVQEEAILLLSDLHAGEVVSKAQMRNLNEYDFDICVSRLKYLAETICDLKLNKLLGYDIKKLHIFGLGDFVSGTIHNELVETSKGNIVDWTLNLAYVLAQMIQELLLAYDEVEFTGVIGNHGRTKKKPQYKDRYVNWDFICYQCLSGFLAKDIASGRVKFDIPLSFWTVKNVQGFSWLLAHGDNINSWAGIPWYGIERAVKDWRELLAADSVHLNYVVLAHFHSLGSLSKILGELLINGSVIGANEYSVGKLRSALPASQWFYGVHKKHGLSYRYRIDLQGVSPEGTPYLTSDLSDVSMGDLLVKSFV